MCLMSPIDKDDGPGLTRLIYVVADVANVDPSTARIYLTDRSKRQLRPETHERIRAALAAVIDRDRSKDPF